MTTPVERRTRPGELVLVDLEPVRGTEQNGRRPALVVSNDDMHLLARRVIICPITRNRDAWPTKVMLPAGLAVEGAVLVDQVRSIDRDARILRSLGFVPDVVLAEVRGRLAALLSLMTDDGTRP
ncbi:type II toxin-antitoxin system PemK/MazF family toxin [Methylobacterium sp. E-025]|uniref:type II toxin-antitoxin system PemK/MazF family toxin n=1 Tax=unclassified Methylobacterium TaxID=2615210 RepID=UPI001FBA7466|nr:MULTISPECIES: type II toxin-antitoxin system PemK/MazF family toxin [unclassified Methylobacterium]MCJ2077220.1 type II toxin-antitoxin system PemK/MazF family toxin [Methylobacterium sp. E-016]MCJ2113866.1 type II toxin-antitoxin system PemK/MazF family toxin [Methylobacterium sp. E-025]